MKKLPELLCPAGSPEALDAAIDGGADAVYLGGACFNARMNAKNFGGDALRSAVLRAHAFGVKVYLTLNTMLTDRELPRFLEAAEEALSAGVDALIVADLGGARAIRAAFPQAELHASTQMSGHSLGMGNVLHTLGFSRMVVARETSASDLRTILAASPIEVEVFVHGALCVSHSGQCLFSSLVGGRSGNRGECAQPCRLPYSCTACAGKRNDYPLSLKDLSLAAHLPDLIDMGVSSLKIEGRMKSPEYVRDTARIWRRLLDERRGATPAEMRELSEIFSRGGLTDGYYRSKVDRSMLGIRSEENKSTSRSLEPFVGLTRKIPLSVSATVRASEPSRMTLSDGTRSVTVTGDVPMAAINAPLTSETVARNLTKFGGTVYAVRDFDVELDEGLMLPISRLNDLRRRALQAWEEGLTLPLAKSTGAPIARPSNKRTARTDARFLSVEQITPLAQSYFDRIFLPLHRFEAPANGVVMPPVIFDGRTDEVRNMLTRAAKNGAKYALVGNLGQIKLVTDAGLLPVGDYRLNVANGATVQALEALGIPEVLLSPELTLPQIRDLGGNTGVIVYGRIPLMTLEKCLIRDLADCKTCDGEGIRLRDRRGFLFPVLREWEHRNVVYNSQPTCMSDREGELTGARVVFRHFLFSVETPAEVDEVIRAHKAHQALPCAVRRI